MLLARSSHPRSSIYKGFQGIVQLAVTPVSYPRSLPSQRLLPTQLTVRTHGHQERSITSSSPARQDYPTAMSSFFNVSRLHDKNVFITGASGGIGRATAVLFARFGANVIITARRLDVLQSVAEECQAANKEGKTGHGGKVHVAQLDMQKRSELDRVREELPDWAKEKVDVLVNNAGLVIGVEKVGEISPEDIDVMYNTNVLGLIHLTQRFVADFKKRGSGHIIQLGSIAGREAYPAGSIYCSSKAAVRAFTSSLLKELVDTQIRVSEVQPGMVETDFSTTRFRGDKAASAKVYEGLDALQSEDIAEEIVWIANRPPHVNVAETLVFPVNQASPYHNHRPGKKAA